MKKLIILGLIVLPLFYMGCTDNSTDTVTSTAKLNGKIVNINVSPGLYLVATVTKNDTFATTIVLDSSLISVDGSFTISLNTPPDNALDSIILPSCIGNIQISSNEVKQAVLNLFVDSLGKQIGDIQKSNHNPTALFRLIRLVSL